jgi:hypothetical protein
MLFRSLRRRDALATVLDDSLARRIRIASERIHLSSLLLVALRGRDDAIRVDPGGLEHLRSFRQLADEGLAQATVQRAEGPVVVLAASTRVWRKRRLKRQFLKVKRDARRLGLKVVLFTRNGLRRMAARKAARDG